MLIKIYSSRIANDNLTPPAQQKQLLKIMCPHTIHQREHLDHANRDKCSSPDADMYLYPSEPVRAKAPLEYCIYSCINRSRDVFQPGSVCHGKCNTTFGPT